MAPKKTAQTARELATLRSRSPRPSQWLGPATASNPSGTPRSDSGSFLVPDLTPPSWFTNWIQFGSQFGIGPGHVSHHATTKLMSHPHSVLDLHLAPTIFIQQLEEGPCVPNVQTSWLFAGGGRICARPRPKTHAAAPRGPRSESIPAPARLRLGQTSRNQGKSQKNVEKIDENIVRAT